LSIKDFDTAAQLVKKLQYGYSFYKTYAQECIEDPFLPTYTMTDDPDLAQNARERWDEFNVPYRELTSEQMKKIEPEFNQEMVSYFFENKDTRINNRLLFQKLFTEIRRNGGIALTGAEYEYENEQIIRVINKNGVFQIQSPQFFYTTGVYLSDSHEKLTGEKLDVQFWKSHLLFLPRFTSVSLVSMDKNAPIIINHGEVSVINRSYDEYPVDSINWEVNEDEVKKALEVISQYYPSIKGETNKIHAIACLKPNVFNKDAIRHTVGEKIYEPVKGHIFALPGKMTEAPYVADMIIQHAYTNFNVDDVTERPIDKFLKEK
jgi:hypothetical protein